MPNRVRNFNEIRLISGIRRSLFNREIGRREVVGSNPAGVSFIDARLSINKSNRLNPVVDLLFGATARGESVLEFESPTSTAEILIGFLLFQKSVSADTPKELKNLSIVQEQWQQLSSEFCYVGDYDMTVAFYSKFPS